MAFDRERRSRLTRGEKVAQSRLPAGSSEQAIATTSGIPLTHEMLDAKVSMSSARPETSAHAMQYVDVWQQTVTKDISVTNGDTAVIPIAWAWMDRKLLDVTYIPTAAFTRDASDYWKFTLVIYDEEGNEERDVPDSLLDLSKFPLAVGKALHLPYYGRFEDIGILWQTSHTLCLKPEETGTAANASMIVQAHFILGRG